jgi:TRAP-type C4-dicarboxylate transport system substrate-binding protein
MVLFAVPWPPQALFAKSEVHSVDDLKGVKFRAYNTATERLAVLAGAVPTQVEVPDIPQAFTTGRVETMMTSASTAVNTKAWDFVTHYYDTQAWLPKNIVVVNKRAFRSLDKNTQTALLEAAQAAEQRGWDMSMKETADQTEVLKKNGMAIHAPSPELMKGLKAIGKQLTKEWLQKAGAQGQAILEAYGAD